ALIPPLAQIDPQVVEAVGEAVSRSDKPCVATYLGMRGVTAGAGVPAYPMPEDGVRALAAVVGYADWLGRDRGERVRPEGVSRKDASAVIDEALTRSTRGVDLSPEEVRT